MVLLLWLSCANRIDVRILPQLETSAFIVLEALTPIFSIQLSRILGMSPLQ